MPENASLHQMLAYWEARAPHYSCDDVFGRNIVKAYLDKLRPKSLIEVGCGNGELFPMYRNVAYVVAVDWSVNMLQRAELRKSRHYMPNVHIKRHDITRFSPSGHYDIALTRTVLMHIPPEHIEKTVRHIVKVADAFIIFEYYESVLLHPLSPHCWLHNYIPLFESNGCHMVEAYQRPDQPQVLFYFKKDDVVRHHEMPSGRLVVCH